MREKEPVIDGTECELEGLIVLESVVVTERDVDCVPVDEQL